MKSSYIIPYRDSEIRRKNLNIVLENLKSFDDVEIIIVEQDKEKKLQLNSEIKHVFIKHSGLFNRSWALNVGAINSSTELFTFADGDILIQKQNYKDTIKCCEQYDVVDPMYKLWFLPENVTNYFSNNNATLIGGTNFCGGIVTFKKDKFFEIKGWDECFEGWGEEDEAMTIKIKIFNFSMLQLHFELFHLYHDRIIAINHEHTKLNNQIIRSIRNFDLEQLKINHLNKIITIGNQFSYNIRND